MFSKEGIIAYKGFDKNLCCRGFKYIVGKIFKITNHKRIEICHNGFHACKNPLHIFHYYYLNPFIRICKVRQFNTIDEFIDKTASSAIEILEEFSIDSFVDECIKFTKASCEKMRSIFYNFKTKDYSIANIDVKYGISHTLGSYSIASSKGYSSTAICNTLDSIAYTKGDKTISITRSERSLASCDGDRSLAIVMGDTSTAFARSCGSIAICYGQTSNVKGVKDSWLVFIGLANGKICCIKSVCVDGINIKENVPYFMNSQGIIKEVF